MAGDEQLRLFVAFPLPEDCWDAVVAWQARELAGGDRRLVPPENFHLTIAFLGSRPAEEVGPVAEVVREAARTASQSKLELVKYREKRSVGMLVFTDSEGGVTACATAIQRELERRGLWRSEARPWLPHLTVMRFGRPPRLKPDLPALGGVCPSEAAVYMSRLRRGGAQYVVLESAALGG